MDSKISLLLAVPIAFLVAVAMGPGTPTKDGAARPTTYTFSIEDRAAEVRWRLALANGAGYFEHGRERRADDKDTDRLTELAYRFDMTSDEGGTITTKRDERIGEQFLSVDYSVTPPVVVFERKKGEHTTWTVRKAEDDTCHLENVNDKGKPGWLAMDDKASLLVPLNGGMMVSEFRRAIISYEKKSLITVDKGYNDESK